MSLDSFWAAARRSCPALPCELPEAWAFGATEEEAIAKAEAHMAAQAAKKTTGGRKASKSTPQPEEIEEAI